MDTDMERFITVFVLSSFIEKVWGDILFAGVCRTIRCCKNPGIERQR